MKITRRLPRPTLIMTCVWSVILAGTWMFAQETQPVGEAVEY